MRIAGTFAHGGRRTTHVGIRYNGRHMSPSNVAGVWEHCSYPARSGRREAFPHFYSRDAMLARHLLSSRVCSSVRLSQVGVVPKRLNIDQGLYFYGAKDLYEILMGLPPSAGGVGKNCVFRPVENSPAQMSYAENFCPCGTVIYVHDGALAEEYAVSSTTLVVVKVR